MRSESEQRLLLAFGEKLKRVRLSRGFSQEELAAVAGVHRTYIGMIERGEKNATLITIVRFARALGVTVSELLPCQKNGQ